MITKEHNRDSFILDHDEKSYRFYHYNKHILPSVTTILEHTKTDDFLEKWKARVGIDEANRLTEFSKVRGTLYHKWIEHVIVNKLKSVEELLESLDKVSYENVEEEVLLKTISLIKKIINNPFVDQITKTEEVKLLDYIKTVLFTEQKVGLVFKDVGGYAGSFDMLFKNHNNEIILLDFKTSFREKKTNMIQNYLLQLAAYWHAIEINKKIKIDEAIVIIANDETEIIQKWSLSKDYKDYYLEYFYNKVKIFHETRMPKISNLIL